MPRSGSGTARSAHGRAHSIPASIMGEGGVPARVTVTAAPTRSIAASIVSEGGVPARVSATAAGARRGLTVLGAALGLFTATAGGSACARVLSSGDPSCDGGRCPSGGADGSLPGAGSEGAGAAVSCEKPCPGPPVCGADLVTYLCGASQAVCRGAPVFHEGPCSKCSIDADCLAHEHCTTADGDCRPPPGCTPGESCVTACGGVCADGPSDACAAACSKPAVCGEDLRTYECGAAAAQCAGVRPFYRGRCTDCTTDADCLPGDWCAVAAECLPPPGCGPDGDCRGCGGTCVPRWDDGCGAGCAGIDEPVCGTDGATWPCATAAGCAGVPTFYPRACSDCVGDADCASGATCSTRRGDCLPPPGCAPGLACAPVCGGVCEAAPPPEPVLLPPPGPGECDTNGHECPGTEICVIDACVECPAGATCLFPLFCKGHCDPR